MRKLRKPLSWLLAVCMLFSLLPGTAWRRTRTRLRSRTRPPTPTGEDLFGVGGSAYLTTKDIGRIWTDKSVSTQDIKLPGTTIEGLTDNTVKKEAGADFLVALSGLGSAATIVDETKVPTDTVIVLDMAPEMEPYVEDMVAAANDALENLLTANPNNRIAVVAYGNTAIPCCRWITTATIPISPRRSCCRLGSMITVFGQIPLMSLPMARRMRASQLSRKNLSLTAEKRETRRLVFIPVWIFCSKRRIPLSPWTVSS